MDIIDRLRVLRSKNAGPFVITMDVLFQEETDFQRVKSGLTRGNIAAAYNILENEVLSFGFFDELKAAKVSIKRRLPCGHPGDPDCFAMNQEQPLGNLLRELAD